MKHDSKLTPYRRFAAVAILALSGAAMALAAGCSANTNLTPGSGGGPNVPGPSIKTFSPDPLTINQNETTTLSWTATGAKSCSVTATDPYGDTVTDPNLAGPFSGNDSVTTSALAKTGVYHYTLTCKTANGGTSTRTTPVYVVKNGAPTITITQLSADPASIQAGAASNTSVLTWDHPEATGCALSGTQPNGQPVTGLPAGSQAAQNGSVPTPPQTAVGTYSYALACTNTQTGRVEQPDTATVTVVGAQQSELPLFANANQVAAGGNVTLLWNHDASVYSSCTASETDPNGNPVVGGGAFTGMQPVANGSFTTGALNTVGAYTFTLSCTAISGGQNLTDPAVKVQVTQANPNVADGNCNVQSNAVQLVNASGATSPFKAAGATSGICIGCSVSSPENAVDSSLTNTSTVNTLISLLGGGSNGAAETLTVTNTDMTTANGKQYPAGKIAGFVVQTANQVLGAGVLQSVTISTLQNGQPTGDTANVAGGQGGAIKAKVLGLTGGSGAQSFVALPTTKPFNAVAIRLASVLAVNNQIKVYYACVADPAPVTP